MKSFWWILLALWVGYFGISLGDAERRADSCTGVGVAHG